MRRQKSWGRLIYPLLLLLAVLVLLAREPRQEVVQLDENPPVPAQAAAATGAQP